LDLHDLMKGNEDLQLCIMQFVVESIILANDEEQVNKSVIVTLSDLQRAKDFIHDLIQNVAMRIKGNDSVVLE
jgi:hypothetical protein